MCLSETMPALTDAELRKLGGYIVEHYDHAVSARVADQAASLEYFLDLAGISDTQANRDRVCHQLGTQGYAAAEGFDADVIVIRTKY